MGCEVRKAEVVSSLKPASTSFSFVLCSAVHERKIRVNGRLIYYNFEKPGDRNRFCLSL